MNTPKLGGAIASMFAASSMAIGAPGDQPVSVYTFAHGISADNGGFVARNLGVSQFTGQGAIYDAGDDPDEAIEIVRTGSAVAPMTEAFFELDLRNTGHRDEDAEGMLSLSPAAGRVGGFQVSFQDLESDQSFRPRQGMLLLRFEHLGGVATLNSGVRDNDWTTVRVETSVGCVNLLIDGRLEATAPIEFDGYVFQPGDSFRIGGQRSLTLNTTGELASTGFSGRVASFGFGARAPAPCQEELAAPALTTLLVPADADNAVCDRNGDGLIDAFDVVSYTNDFMAGGGDLDGNGVADATDLLMFLECLDVGAVRGADCCRDVSGAEIDRLSGMGLQYVGIGCDESMNEQGQDCDGDPLMAPTVIVRVTDKSDPADDGARVYFEGVVALGARFDVSAGAAGRQELPGTTYVHLLPATGGTDALQMVKMKTDCSKALRIGDTFGGVRVTDSFDVHGASVRPTAGVGGGLFEVRYDAISGWDPSLTVDGFIDTKCGRVAVYDGEFVELRPTIDLGAPDPCADDAHPFALTMEYTGGSCDRSLNLQDLHDDDCVGDPALASQVYVRCTDKENPNDLGGHVSFEGEVRLGEAFTASAATSGDDRLKKDLHVHVFADVGRTSLLQSVYLKADCSRPIRIGDRYGSVRIVGMTDEDGRVFDRPSVFDCGFDTSSGHLRVTSSSAQFVVTAVDGAERHRIVSSPVCGPRSGHDGCDLGEPTEIDMLYTTGGCGSTVTAQPDDRHGCVAFGPLPGHGYAVATNKENPFDDNPRVYFDGEVSLGRRFTISAPASGHDSLESRTYVHLFADETRTVLLQTVEFRTDCGDPLRIDDVYGGLRIIGFARE